MGRGACRAPGRAAKDSLTTDFDRFCPYTIGFGPHGSGTRTPPHLSGYFHFTAASVFSAQIGVLRFAARSVSVFSGQKMKLTTQKPLAGMAGLEPACTWVKATCLTAWRHPNISSARTEVGPCCPCPFLERIVLRSGSYVLPSSVFPRLELLPGGGPLKTVARGGLRSAIPVRHNFYLGKMGGAPKTCGPSGGSRTPGYMVPCHAPYRLATPGY